jgi:hypothetical protein
MTDSSGDDLAARLRAVEDRAALHDLLVRYAVAVDSGDTPAGVGGPAIATFLMATMGPGPKPPTTHRVGNVLVTLDGDRANVQSSAIVYGIRGEPLQLRLRGVSYADLCVRTAGGWRIQRRTHSPAWEGAAENVPLTPINPK